MMAPSVIIIFMIMLYPTFYNLTLSLFSWSWYTPAPWHFVGFSNYIKIATDPDFLQAIRNTFFFAGVSVSFEFLVGLGIALLLNANFKGRRIFRTVFLVPMMIAPIVTGIQWRFMFAGTYGVINYILVTMGVHNPPKWLSDPSLALYAVVIANSWIVIPFMVLVLLAGLQAIPVEQYEAAEIDGAPRWQVLRHITLPSLKPTILIVLLLAVGDALKAFDIVYALTKGGPANATQVLSLYTYRIAFMSGEMGLAAAAAVYAVVMVLFVSILLLEAVRTEVPII